MGDNSLREVYRFQKTAGLLKENDLDLSDSPEFGKLFYIIDTEGLEPPQGPYLRKKASEVLKSLGGDGYAIISQDVADEIYSLNQFDPLNEDEDINLSDLPKFNHLKSEVRSELRNAGVDLNRSFWVEVSLPGQRYDKPVEMNIEGFTKKIEQEAKQFYDEFYDMDIEFDTEVEKFIRPIAVDNKKAPIPPLISVVFTDDSEDRIVQSEYTVYQERRLQEDEDLDLSDTPNFTGNIKARLRSAFIKAGVDLNKPILIINLGNNGQFIRRYDNPLDYGQDLQAAVGDYSDEGYPDTDVIFYTNLDLQSKVYNWDTYDPKNMFGSKIQDLYNSSSPVEAKLEVYLDYGGGEEPESIIFQRLEKTLKKEDGLDLSNAPKFLSRKEELESEFKKASIDFTKPIYVEYYEGVEQRYGGGNITTVREFIDSVSKNFKNPDTGVRYASGEDLETIAMGSGPVSNTVEEVPKLLVSIDRKTVSIEFLIYQEEKLREEDNLDLSDAPEFKPRNKYELDPGFIKWIGELYFYDFQDRYGVGADIEDVGLEVINYYKLVDPGLLEDEYEDYLEDKAAGRI